MEKPNGIWMVMMVKVGSSKHARRIIGSLLVCFAICGCHGKGSNPESAQDGIQNTGAQNTGTQNSGAGDTGVPIEIREDGVAGDREPPADNDHTMGGIVTLIIRGDNLGSISFDDEGAFPVKLDADPSPLSYGLALKDVISSSPSERLRTHRAFINFLDRDAKGQPLPPNTIRIKVRFLGSFLPEPDDMSKIKVTLKDGDGWAVATTRLSSDDHARIFPR